MDIGSQIPPGVYLSGVLMFVGRLAIVCAHNHWARDWTVLSRKRVGSVLALICSDCSPAGLPTRLRQHDPHVLCITARPPGEYAMTCWPPCNPWCDCINGQCQTSAVKINAVRFRTPDGRYLTKAAGEVLTASLSAPSQSATFRLVSRPSTAPLTIPPPATLPMPSGSPISLAVCDSNWAPSTNLMRTEHSTLTFAPPPPKDFWEALAQFFGGRPPTTVTHYFGGPDTFVRVSGPLPSGYPAYVSDSNPSEWVFSILKNGGGSINSGDQVSLRIDSSRANVGPFYFRTSSASNQALVAADGTVAFQQDTLFVVEFHEVNTTLGLRPTDSSILCQVCGPVRGIVKDAVTGAAIPGATVEALGVLDNHAFSATTNANGSFILTDSEGRTCVPPGNVTLRATADRHEPKTTPPIPDPSVGAGANVPISLDCTKVKGRVIDKNVPPNPQIFVQVTIEFQDGTTETTTTRTPDGTFTFDCVRHGSANIWTTTLPSQSITVLPQGISVELVVDTGCVEIIGTVTDSVTDLPICDALVLYFGSNNSDRTDVQGRYRIPCASPGGSKSLLVHKDPWYDTRLVLVANPFPTTGSVMKDITLEPTSIPYLFNTGVDACGKPLADGTIGDPHYTLTSVPSGTTGIRVRTSAGGYPVPPYEADNTDSTWIGPNGDAMLNGPAGEYVYRTMFSLTGLDLNSVSIKGNWSTDNNGVRIVLNGTDTGNLRPILVNSSWGSCRLSSTAALCLV